MAMTGPELLVDRYELRGVLGRGGMAEVRDGWDARLDRAVAIKLLHPTLTARADLRRLVRTEAHSAARLSHPNIVAVYDFGEHNGAPFIVMERLPGESLADVIARGPVPPEGVYGLLDDVLAALSVLRPVLDHAGPRTRQRQLDGFHPGEHRLITSLAHPGGPAPAGEA